MPKEFKVYEFKNFEIILDILRRYNVIDFGFCFGSNKFYRRERKNFFIEISLIFWTFGFEISGRKLY